MPIVRINKMYVEGLSVSDDGTLYGVLRGINPKNAVDVPMDKIPDVCKFVCDHNDGFSQLTVNTDASKKDYVRHTDIVDVDTRGLRLFFFKRNISMRKVGLLMGMDSATAHNARKYLNGDLPFPKVYFTRLTKHYPSIYYYINRK